jgi:hypothetical protein
LPIFNYEIKTWTNRIVSISIDVYELIKSTYIYIYLKFIIQKIVLLDPEGYTRHGNFYDLNYFIIFIIMNKLILI